MTKNIVEFNFLQFHSFFCAFIFSLPVNEKIKYIHIQTLSISKTIFNLWRKFRTLYFFFVIFKMEFCDR